MLTKLNGCTELNSDNVKLNWFHCESFTIPHPSYMERSTSFTILTAMSKKESHAKYQFLDAKAVDVAETKLTTTTTTTKSRTRPIIAFYLSESFP